MNQVIPEISDLWGQDLKPTHCTKCDIAHLIPAKMDTALCPACYNARLVPQPTVIRPEPPEMLLDYKITPIQIKEYLKNWLKGVWLHPKELSPEILAQRLTRTFIPVWLVDGRVTGSWQAQMGYDYQVASSQEVFHNGGWTTRRQTETRIRWEPRVGTVERYYQNLSVPALEEHTSLKRGLGEFDLKAASDYSPSQLEIASIRVPSLLPDTAWPLAKSGFDRLTARDCQIASDAQHVDEFIIEADYQNLNWTQLLLPVYTTAYRDENGKVYPILIHGQNGKILGIRRASQQQARNLSLGLIIVALVCFLLGLLLAAGTTLLPLLSIISLVFFGGALLAGIIAPIPAFWAWNFNRIRDKI
jgi:hypothetical protein